MTYEMASNEDFTVVLSSGGQVSFPQVDAGISATIATQQYVDSAASALSSQIDAESPLLARSFAIQQQVGWTYDRANEQTMYFRPRYFGMNDGDLFKGIIIRTKDLNLTPFPVVYMRLKRYSDGSVLGISEAVEYPNTANTDVVFRLTQAVALPSKDSYYIIDFATTPDGSAITQFGMRIYVVSGGTNPDCYFQASNFVPVMTVQFYSFAEVIAPSASTELGQLADAYETKLELNAISSNISSNYYTKDKTDEAIERVAAYYITYNANGDAFPTASSLVDATTYYSGGQLRVPTRNDYAVVLSDELHGNAEWRYIYAMPDGQATGQWEAQYPIETNDYEALLHKPSINSVTLSGNKTAYQLGLAAIDDATLTERGFSEWDILNTPLTQAQKEAFYNESSQAAANDYAVTIVGTKLYIGNYLAAELRLSNDELSLTFFAGSEEATAIWGPAGTTVATRTAMQGYTLGSQTDKPLASETEAEALRMGKADKPMTFTVGNLAEFDANGNPADSGVKPSDKFDSTSVAPEFGEDKTYDVGNYVTYNGKLYRCKNAYTATPQSTTPDSDTTHWESSTVEDELVKVVITIDTTEPSFTTTDVWVYEAETDESRKWVWNEHSVTGGGWKCPDAECWLVEYQGHLKMVGYGPGKPPPPEGYAVIGDPTYDSEMIMLENGDIVIRYGSFSVQKNTYHIVYQDDLASKANLAPNPTPDNLAALDADGNPTDSGIGKAAIVTNTALSGETLPADPSPEEMLDAFKKMWKALGGAVSGEALP